MFLVLGLRKSGNEDPQEFELKLKDSGNKNHGYTHTTKYGTEPQLRTTLKDAGIPDAEIDELFTDAKAHS